MFNHPIIKYCINYVSGADQPIRIGIVWCHYSHIIIISVYLTYIPTRIIVLDKDMQKWFLQKKEKHFCMFYLNRYNAVKLYTSFSGEACAFYTQYLFESVWNQINKQMVTNDIILYRCVAEKKTKPLVVNLHAREPKLVLRNDNIFYIFLDEKSTAGFIEITCTSQYMFIVIVPTMNRFLRLCSTF